MQHRSTKETYKPKISSAHTFTERVSHTNDVFSGDGHMLLSGCSQRKRVGRTHVTNCKKTKPTDTA